VRWHTQHSGRPPRMVHRSAVFNALLAALVAVLLDQLRSRDAGFRFPGVCLPIASVSGQSRLLIKGNVWQTRAQMRRRMRRLRPANRTMWGRLVHDHYHGRPQRHSSTLALGSAGLACFATARPKHLHAMNTRRDLRPSRVIRLGQTVSLKPAQPTHGNFEKTFERHLQFSEPSSR
jgi:hypothetical protein